MLKFHINLPKLLEKIENTASIEGLPDGQTKTTWLAKYYHNVLLSPFHHNAQGNLQRAYCYTKMRDALAPLLDFVDENEVFEFELASDVLQSYKNELLTFDNLPLGVPDVIIDACEVFDLDLNNLPQG